MGGEGASWIGLAPFTETGHDSPTSATAPITTRGSLAMRAAIAAGVNVTYKLLYNDAVAMTGGQKVAGNIRVPAMARELAPKASRASSSSPRSRTVIPRATTRPRHRGDGARPRRLRPGRARQVAGVSVLILDQMCAAERRRRRRRGKLAEPARCAFINERVCEGCGDCRRVRLPLGRAGGDGVRPQEPHRPATCNKDKSCLDGDCPAFVTVEGGRPLRRTRTRPPKCRRISRTCPARPAAPAAPRRIMVAGIGGTGVVTIGS